MDRIDLNTLDAVKVICDLNELILKLQSKGLYITSWYGSLPPAINFSLEGFKNIVRIILGNAENKEGVGIANRGIEYQPLDNAADDRRIPWYLYWEIFWVIRHGPKLDKGMRLLDAGGASSLFSCYLASKGYEVHSIDINKSLIHNGNKIAKAMNWNMTTYLMNIKELKFEDCFFDHAYSICVFEHIDYTLKKIALKEIARCLKQNGIFSATFDYRNPAVAISNMRTDISDVNQLVTKKDIERSFLSTDCFELIGNADFHDNSKSYLVNRKMDNAPYTFGSIFLRKKA